MRRIILSPDNPFDEAMLERSGTFDADVLASTAAIIAEVRAGGDEAVRSYTERFDHVKLESFRVPDAEIDAAIATLSDTVVSSIEKAAEHIRSFHTRQFQQSWFTTRPDGAFLGNRITPIASVGLYVPGGRARYPSTVLMDAIPAKVAGVGRIAMVTPPARDGHIDAATLLASRVAGVDEVYCVGGAQAVAALAYGTESIAKVDKIVGPGNVFVAAAKKLVSGDVGIDMIAGPSEVCILTDEQAVPEYVAIDLMAQAEHDPNAICFLVCPSVEQADAIEVLIDKMMPDSPRAEITQASLDNNGMIFVTSDMDEAVRVANTIAPEHLEVQTTEPMQLLGRLTNAGAIFLGNYTPTPVGDYIAGPNHTLPTSGTARFSNPLGVWDYVKISSVVQYTYDTLSADALAIETIAEQEGLWSHSRAISLRMEMEAAAREAAEEGR